MRRAFVLWAILIGMILWAMASTVNRQIEAITVERARIANAKKPDIQVTLVEGKRREEYAKLLSEKGVTQYAAFMAASQGMEGKLFPDTYRFFPNSQAEDVVKTINETYKRKSGQPTSEQLILASIVEREALTDTDRLLIAGVYTNRLKRNMPLQADPTVEYAKDSQALQDISLDMQINYQFWTAISQRDYSTVLSPFNTYGQPGLPPAPIANPGLKSIEAALHPAQHDYLFMYYKNKQLLLATSFEGHLRNQR
jgi:UPF0755 protein